MRVATTSQLALRRLSRVLPEVRHRFPAVALEATTRRAPETSGLLLRGEIDLAIGTGMVRARASSPYATARCRPRLLRSWSSALRARGRDAR